MKKFSWNAFWSVIIVTFCLPICIYVMIGHFSLFAIEIMHFTVSMIYGVTSVMLMYEAILAVRRRRAPISMSFDQEKLKNFEIPKVTAIIAAYLPNEIGIILETLDHYLTQLAVPPDKLQIILAYNRPKVMPEEVKLHELAERYPNFRPLVVTNSRSKAQNVNAGVAIATGEIIGIFDADHLPDPYCFHKAWRWLSTGYDVVQGRCVVRNLKDNWFTRMITIEFETIYAIAHCGRSLMTKTAIFGGSNGYWRRDVIRAIGLDHSMLTEDIDSSIRAMLAGYKIIHDRTIISDELAVTNFSGWWGQRKRWAQGWFEVTLKHQSNVLTSSHLSVFQKIMWCYMLGWREAYPWISCQVFNLIIAAILLGVDIQWFSSWYFVLTTFLTLFSGPFVTWATYHRTLWRMRKKLGIGWYVFYGGVFCLGYVMLKNLVALVGQFDHFVGQNTWVTTARTRTSTSETKA